MKKSIRGRCPDLTALRAQAEKKVDSYAAQDINIARLEREVDYEAHKLKKAEEKERKKKQAVGKQQTIVIEPVVSLLLVFHKTEKEAKAAGYKSNKKLFALCLWEKGPQTAAVTDFNGTPIMQEYRDALDRQDFEECRCVRCELGNLELNESERAVHCAWHAKFRKYLVLRREHYPEYSDFGILPHAEESRLVMLWQQVDRDLPYFVTAKFLEYAASGRQLEREARRKRAAALLAHQKAKKKKAAKAAEKASTKKKNKSGMRQPRLVASTHCMFL